MSTVDRAIVASDAPYRDPALPIAERVADLLARMTVEEKVAQLGSAWVFQLADGSALDVDKGAELLRHGIGQVTRISGASSLAPRDAAVLANSIQHHLVDGDPLGHPGDRPRGDLLGIDVARLDDLPAGDWARQHVAARARRRPRRRRAHPDAGDGRPPRTLPGARHLPRPAVGTHRGDVRRGSVPRCSDGCLVRQRLAG